MVPRSDQSGQHLARWWVYYIFPVHENAAAEIISGRLFA